MGRKCSCCGAELNKNVQYCPVCGKKQELEEKKELEKKAEPEKKTEPEPEKEKQKEAATRKATISVILGFVTWGLLFTPALLVSLVTCVVGLVLGVQGLKSGQKKTAIAGLVMNGLFALLFLWGVVLGLSS